MYELELFFESTGFIIFAIVQIVFWVIFFVLAYNVWKMKKILSRSDSKFILDRAKRYDFAGNKQKAIEHYLEYIYVIENTTWATEHKEALIKKVKERIVHLGGAIPENPSIF